MGRRKSALLPGYGDRLKKARQALGLKQTGLSDIVDVREFTLSRYENEVVEPDRCFLAALEYLTGIQMAYVERGEEPMLKPPSATNGPSTQALLDRLENELGANDPVKLIPYPLASGLGGMQAGDYLVIEGVAGPLQDGVLYLIEGDDGQPIAGTARKGPNGWLLYHEADLEAQGQYPPTQVKSEHGVKIKARILFCR